MLYLDNLFLDSVEWSFEILNLLITNCLLAASCLEIYQNLSNESYEGLFVSIDGSCLGYLRASNVSQIKIRNSNITGRYAENSSSFS